MKLRETLFASYAAEQGRCASANMYSDVWAPWPYYDANYSAILNGIGHSARILEIGCGPGNLLSWLRHKGYLQATGVDLSPGDVSVANSHLGPGTVTLGDCIEFLQDRNQQFDVIIMKATLEHIERERLLPLLEQVKSALAAGGIAVIDVPNMDWLMASHERYMDLTHETGFTIQSLKVLLSTQFSDVRITGSRVSNPTLSQRLFRRALVRGLRFMLYVLGEGANEVLFESRSIIAVARKEH